MSLKIKALVENKLSVAANYTVDDQVYIDNSKIDNSITLVDGTGAENIDTTYFATLDVTADSGSYITVDLVNLTKTIFNSQVTTDFSGGKIMAMLFENATTGHDYPLTYEVTGVNSFDNPFKNGFEYDIYPGTSFAVQKLDGWDVDGNNRYIRFKTNAPSPTANSIVQIGIAGQIN